ncbi:PAS domain-containing protein [Nostoc sp. FACHB-152]|uniref:PAS domain-containing protein n=1 Tax=unclassified Nostoc TaxID=2593658 RepID=UPI001685C985|nr:MULTISPECIES: PAS domain-containing protein [unclassified Nostoc]MBD2448946.1 PAS domain-containing protein [Nostoc sp. FACHB-152]MBD2469414.1 PAS domain-containing protein [Nostoc sp. FACHB-145]
MNQQQRTVLIVDDSPGDCELYRRYLLQDREYKYNFLVAELGQLGLELWRDHQPDIVLLDYRLPDLDGVEFLLQLQTMMRQSLLPVIVVTGLGNEAIAVQAMQAGAQNYLVKGAITAEELQQTVNGAIEKLELHNQLQKRVEKERLLNRIIQQIYKSSSLQGILQTTVNEVRQFLQTDRVIIFRLYADANGQVIAESVGSQWQPILNYSMTDPCLAEDYIERYRQGLLNLDPTAVDSYIERYRQGLVTSKRDIFDGTIDQCHVELLAQFQVRANLVVPILHDNYFWGILIAHHCAAPRNWQRSEIDLLQELATHISIAIRQSEALQQAQHELAQHKRTQSILQESEQRLQLALKAARMGTWDWNILTGEIKWSENLEALFGLKVGEFNGSLAMFFSRVHPDDRDHIQEAINAAISTGADYNIEFRVVYPNNNIRWALSQGQVFYNQAGQAVRMAGVDLDITERKLAEELLTSSEERLQLSLEGSGNGLWDWNIVTDELYLSPRWLEMLGYQVGELPSHVDTWKELIYPEDKAFAIERLNAHLLDSSVPYKFDYRMITKSGEPKWIANYGKVVVRDENGQPLRMAGIHQDISDRKLAEEELQLKAQILAQTHDSIVSTDLNGYITSWNPGVQRVFGYSAQDTIGQHITMLYAPQNHAFLQNQVIEPLKAQGSHEIEVIAQSKSGKPLELLLSLSLLRDRNQNPVGMIGFSMDITARKQVEAELRQSEARYRFLAETIPHLVWTCDANGNCDYVNQKLCEYTGLTTEEALGFGWLSAVHPEDVESTQSMWLLALANSTFYKHEYRFRRNSDGSYRWHLILGFPLKDEQEQVLNWFGTCTDIHEQKELEIERDRILELEQVARNEAERANRIKDEFLAILSHELRSPLNPILGWTKLLQSRRLDENKTVEALATIERNAKLQTQLIDDLLDVAKILRGKLSLNPDPVNLTFVIEAAIDTVRTAAVAKSILIHPELPNIGQVSGDAVRLQQVVWNLLSNAIKFTPQGGRVEIWLQRLDNQAQIIVTDNGKGINPDFIPYIFESFRQEDVSVNRKYGGLGLGLAIVRHIVEAHAGTVTVDSQGEGQGSTFTVSLPLLNIEPESDRTEKLSADELNLTGIKILTIDDEPDSRNFLTIMLADYGAEVMTVATSSEFLAAIESFGPDVLVSDIGMPEVDGYTLIRQVRSLPSERSKQIPAIALTAYAGEINEQQALAAGFQKHLSKPIDPDILVQAVIKIIRN